MMRCGARPQRVRVAVPADSRCCYPCVQALAELLQLLHVLVADLPPKFRNLQRQVLVHQLKLDQRLGRVTAARLLQLLPLQVDTWCVPTMAGDACMESRRPAC